MVSAVLHIPTALAFASQHYGWGGLFIRLSLPTPLRPPLLSGIKKTKEIKSRGGGVELLSYQALQVCLPYIFYLPVQDKANIFDKFCVKYK